MAADNSCCSSDSCRSFFFAGSSAGEGERLYEPGEGERRCWPNEAELSVEWSKLNDSDGAGDEGICLEGLNEKLLRREIAGDGALLLACSARAPSTLL